MASAGGQTERRRWDGLCRGTAHAAIGRSRDEALVRARRVVRPVCRHGCLLGFEMDALRYAGPWAGLKSNSPPMKHVYYGVSGRFWRRLESAKQLYRLFFFFSLLERQFMILNEGNLFTVIRNAGTVYFSGTKYNTMSRYASQNNTLTYKIYYFYFSNIKTYTRKKKKSQQ